MKQNVNRYLAEEPIGRLMLKFSIPCIMSLLVSALYNIVDQIFIGRGVGYLGNGATNVVFPITIIALSLALLIGDGCAAFLSICQGKKDDENAHRSVGNAILFTILVSIVLTIFFILMKNQVLLGFGATENTLAYADEYFTYIVIGIPFFMFANMMNSIIRADGSPQFAMLSTLAGCIINVILDPLAIFVLGWGMMGAALATIIGQIVTAILALYYVKHLKSVTLTKSSFHLRFSLLKQILPLGISSFLTQISIVVIMGVMNNVLVIFGAQSKYGADIPLTVVGIVMKVFQIVISFVVGIAAGAQPIVGYNYGAQQMQRVKKLFRTMLLAEVAVGLVAMVCFEFFPLQIIQIFGSENDLYNEFAVLAFRLYLGTIVLCCVQKATSIFLQSLGKPVLSIGLSLLRDFVLSVPFVLLLPNMFGVEGTLYSAPLADIISFFVVIAVSIYILRHLDAEHALANEYYK
ncbi:MATE family efflux transporter [Erysipelotrichaceae bacterium AF15-26LB]|nr:MATE family efflux transporter [[Clostridium] innocuum]RJV85194.1 MATE family efflux transporter [Erysipelotrichaceae bacterium AF15-26LB]RJV88108.1 MATE family efflux transporter [Erysipelotrichaceae bacterium AF19-24AC]